MLCMTNFARGHAGLAGARRRRRRSTAPPRDKSADILRCDELQPRSLRPRIHLLDGARRLPPRGCWRAGENIAWGTGAYGDRALDLPRLDALPGPPREHPRPLRPDRHRPRGSATSTATPAPTSGPRSSAPTAVPRARRQRRAWPGSPSRTSLAEASRAPRIAPCPTPSTSPTATATSATELTRGPWDPGAQHAGPPSALLGREIERLPDAGEFQVGRVTFEILRPVPIAPVAVERPGRPPRPPGAAGRGRAERRRARC